MADELGNGSSLTNDNGAGTQNAQPSGQEGNSQAAQADGQQAANAGAQDIIDWTKDERYKRMWSNKDVGDPNKLYKSYREIEKVFDPLKKESGQLKQQVSELAAICKEYGIKYTNEQLKEVLTEYKTYKDPETPENKALAELQYWINNEATSEQVVKFFNQLRQEELMRKYPGMNAEQIRKQSELEGELAAQKKELEQIKFKENYNNNLKSIDSQTDKAKAYAEKKGFTWTDDIKNALLDDCIKNKVLPKDIYARFIDLYNEQVDKAYAEKIRNDQLKDLNKNKGTVTLPAGTQMKPASKIGATIDSLKDGLRKALAGQSGT